MTSFEAIRFQASVYAGQSGPTPRRPGEEGDRDTRSRTTLLPITKIDALEFALDDRAHLPSIVCRDTTREIRERSRVFVRRDGERHASVLRDPLGPRERPQDSVLVHRFDPPRHQPTVAASRSC